MLQLLEKNTPKHIFKKKFEIEYDRRLCIILQSHLTKSKLTLRNIDERSSVILEEKIYKHKNKYTEKNKS
jgi:hypothetical protein